MGRTSLWMSSIEDGSGLNDTFERYPHNDPNNDYIIKYALRWKVATTKLQGEPTYEEEKEDSMKT